MGHTGQRATGCLVRGSPSVQVLHVHLESRDHVSQRCGCPMPFTTLFSGGRAAVEVGDVVVVYWS